MMLFFSLVVVCVVAASLLMLAPANAETINSGDRTVKHTASSNVLGEERRIYVRKSIGYKVD